MTDKESLTLDLLRGTLDIETRNVLSSVFEYYVTNGEWIPERALHNEWGGKEKTRMLLNRVGGNAVFLTKDPSEGFRRYELSLLGLLLTQEGEVLEQLLADYLSFAKEIARKEPKRSRISSSEVNEKRGLDDEQTKRLGIMIRRSWQFNSGGSYSDDDWSADLPKDIEDVPDETLPFIRRVITEGYNPRVTVDPEHRHRTTKSSNLGLRLLPSEDTRISQIPLIDPDLVKGTRTYLVSVLEQVNGCYANGFYDACAVMVRRLLETILIECYEAHEIADKIKDASGNFLRLDKLIESFLSQKEWNLSRDSKKYLKNLPSIKGFGDHSAHNRRFVASKNDVDRIANDVRLTVQELVSIAFDK